MQRAPMALGLRVLVVSIVWVLFGGVVYLTGSYYVVPGTFVPAATCKVAAPFSTTTTAFQLRAGHISPKPMPVAASNPCTGHSYYGIATDIPRFYFACGVYGLLIFYGFILIATGRANPFYYAVGGDGQLSSSLLQFGIWTAVLIFSVTYLFVARLSAQAALHQSLEDFPLPSPTLLATVGLSITTAVGARWISFGQRALNAATQVVAVGDGAQTRLNAADLVQSSDSTYPDLTRIQMLSWTVVGAGLYLARVFASGGAYATCQIPLPDAPDSGCIFPSVEPVLLWLMGFSQVVYLGNKAIPSFGSSPPKAPTDAPAPAPNAGDGVGGNVNGDGGNGDGGGDVSTKPVVEAPKEVLPAATFSPAAKTSAVTVHIAPNLPKPAYSGSDSQLAHIIVDRASQRCKIYWRHADGIVELRHDLEAHTDAVGSTNGDPYGPDGLAPPGTYGLGVPQACATRNSDGSVTVHNNTAPDWDRAFGCWFTPLTDTHGLEGLHGRSGIGFHGGGSASPSPFAMHQGWYATCGCIRLQNQDNEQVFVPFVREMQKQGIPITVTIVQDERASTVPASSSVSSTEALRTAIVNEPLAKQDAQARTYLWGVDSAATLLDLSTPNGQTTVDFLAAKTGRPPAFWGRYILSAYAITEAELARMRTLRIPIIPLYNRTGERPAQSAADGRAHAADAIAKAKALGIPSNSLPHPICIYADVESSIAYVGAAWYSGWCAALKNAGYRPGVYGDANDEQFVKPYATAFANDINVQEMYYWASHFNLDITEGRETLASAPIPFEALDFPKLPPFLDNPTYRDRFVLWQYMENAYGNLYDYDLALQPALDSAWRP